MKVSLITLGCNKNEVDSEMILGYMKNRNYEITTDLEEAEIIIVNTCGFIKSAKEEAINTILDAADYKIEGCCKHLIVTGCLAKRYKQDIIKEFPEVDLVIGVDEYPNFDTIFSEYIKSKKENKGLEFKDRIISSTFPTAYIRISDGCNNRCNYCAIPLIRGSLKSRKIEDILEEAKLLASQGIEELIIISQDTTSYGLDIYGKCMLTKLLRELSNIEGIRWIRTLYMYPGKVTDELIEEFKQNSKLCRYFDIPCQHISDNMLKAMNRHTTKQEIYDLVAKIRKELPDAIIRTTMMVGYIGETKEEFEEMLEGIETLKFDRLGAFTFSKEDDTPADKFEDTVLEEEKIDRYNTLMKKQREIVNKKQKEMVGKTLEVLVENVTDDDSHFVCRSYMEAPDVDSRILIKLTKDTGDVIVGSFIKAKIIGSRDYDLIAEVERGE